MKIDKMCLACQDSSRLKQSQESSREIPVTNIAQLCPKDLKDHIVSRLLAAYEDVDRKDEIYIARRSRPKDVHYVDMCPIPFKASS